MPKLTVWHKTILSSIVFLSVIVRLILFWHLPAIITSDSWDYLGAANAIAQQGDFYSQHLRDARVPGYSLMLALTNPTLPMYSDQIVLWQKVIGIGSVLLGIYIGLRLGSNLVAVAMALFLGFNPAYLFSEHAIMTETFFLFALLSFVALWLNCLYSIPKWITGGARNSARHRDLGTPHCSSHWSHVSGRRYRSTCDLQPK